MKIRYLCFFIALFFVLGLCGLQTPFAKSKIKKILSEMLSKKSGYLVEIEKLTGFLPFTCQLEKITFFKDEARIAKAQGFHVRLLPFSCRWQVKEFSFLDSCPFKITGQNSLLKLTKPFFLEIQGKGVCPLDLATDDFLIQAEMHLDLTLKGNLKHPKMQGSILCKKGTFECLKTGTSFEAIEANIECTKNQFILQKIVGTGKEGGTIEGFGNLVWDVKKRFPIDISLSGHKTALISQEMLGIRADSHLKIDGNLDGITISGDAQIQEATFTIPKKFSKSSPKVKIHRIGKKEVLQKAKRPKPAIPIYLDITASIPRNLLIRGKGLHSLWGGSLHFGGTLYQPKTNGTLRLIEGRYRVASKEVTLTTGRLKFNGIKPSEIDLKLKGALDLPEGIVNFKLCGKLSDPDLYIHSNPPMQFKEILSKLFFAHKISNEEGEELILELGKYLTKNLYVGAGKSVNQDKEHLKIKTRLFRNLFLQAEGLSEGGKGSGKLALKWQKSY